MAQVDFVNYFSILFWFYLLFIVYYLSNFSFVIPSLYSVLFIRKYIFLKYILKIKFKINSFINIFNYILLKNLFLFLFYLLNKSIYIYLK